jgi:hypothetical protein
MNLTQDLIKELFFYENGKLFNRFKRSGSALAGEEAGYLQAYGYRRIKINRKLYYSHRLIYMYHNGEITDNLHIDHIDRDKSNNNIENLRLVTEQENQWNRGDKGYCFHKRDNKFMAYIKLNGKRIHLGYFDTAEEAKNAYLKAKKELHIIQKRDSGSLE